LIESYGEFAQGIPIESRGAPTEMHNLHLKPSPDVGRGRASLASEGEGRYQPRAFPREADLLPQVISLTRTSPQPIACADVGSIS
jgi:hypothetical protein